jgi:thiamine kinase-like enzyme
VCAAFEHEIAPILLQAGSTVIHGEFYPLNVLTRQGSIYPVDWESAAVAAGEIDLASLIEGWAPDDSERYSCAYRRARWPDGTPARFERTVAAAKFYWLFRWLGNGPYFATSARGRKRLDALRTLAMKTGVL